MDPALDPTSKDVLTELAALRADVRYLRDRHDIAALFDDFFFNEDRRTLTDEWAASIFTNDVLLELPPEDWRGLDGLASHITDVVNLFGPTHHTTTDCQVEVSGDNAMARVNLSATHEHLDSGQPLLIVWGYLEADARRGPAGWRLSRMSLTKVLRSGDAPQGYRFDAALNVLRAATRKPAN